MIPLYKRSSQKMTCFMTVCMKMSRRGKSTETERRFSRYQGLGERKGMFGYNVLFWGDEVL